ncbi:MAG TPA: hypothetical protein VFM19_08580 [Candidatus Limnocylindria bacterium]|nr:hypothetical protein [Candidatus Limnocylindria bacterium]
MERSASLGAARGIFGLIGIGAVLGAVSTAGDQSGWANPIVPAGIALGLTALAAARWVDAPGTLPALATWLGIGAMGVALAVLWSMLLRTPSPDVLALGAVPSVIILAAGARLVLARLRAGALGTAA